MRVNDTRLLIVSRDPLARAGLASLLSQEPGVAVIGQSDYAAEHDEYLEVFRPDVLVWDLGWDASEGLEAISALAEGSPPVVTLLPEGVSSVQALAAGAKGVLPRLADGPTIASAALSVLRGLLVLDQRIAPFIPVPGLTTATSVELTRREREVLELLAQGLPNKTIGTELGINEHTVKFHVNSILGKLGAQSRTEAVAQATRMGLVLL